MRALLYPTCLVDQCWPEVGLAAGALLEHFGVEVVLADAATCCGQPFANSGFPSCTVPLAAQLVAQFERSRADCVVLPSGSCTAQVHHYPGLCGNDPQLAARAAALADRTFELSQFLLRHGHRAMPGRYRGRVGWHDSCHGLRELGIQQGPRELLRSVRGVELVELRDAAACCGFGGTFAVDLPKLSVAIADHKLDTCRGQELDLLVAGDASCLLHLRSRLVARGEALPVAHLAQVLAAGLPGVPEVPIGPALQAMPRGGG